MAIEYCDVCGYTKAGCACDGTYPKLVGIHRDSWFPYFHGGHITYFAGKGRVGYHCDSSLSYVEKRDEASLIEWAAQRAAHETRRQMRGALKDEQKIRAHFVGAPEFFELNQACVMINLAFPDGFCCHVGSSLLRRDYRDVDIRLMLPDEQFDAMFPVSAGKPEGDWFRDPTWSLLSSAITLWLSKRTGLKIDFQFQRMTDANKMYTHARGCDRSAIGLFRGYEVRDET